jgi:hypothetical protein
LQNKTFQVFDEYEGVKGAKPLYCILTQFSHYGMFCTFLYANRIHQLVDELMSHIKNVVNNEKYQKKGGPNNFRVPVSSVAHALQLGPKEEVVPQTVTLTKSNPSQLSSTGTFSEDYLKAKVVPLGRYGITFIKINLKNKMG